jgi:ankyrin repeat protein
VRSDQIDIVNMMMNTAGVDVNVMDNRRRTPVYLGVENRRREIVKVLLAGGARFDLLPANGRSLVCEAVLGQDVKLLEDLVNMRGMPIFRPDGRGWTPLHFASQLGRVDLIEFFEQIDPGSVRTPDQDGQLPLHVAAIWNQLVSVKFFLASDCDVNARDLEGDTPLHHAVRSHNIEIVRLLAAAQKVDLNAQNAV